MKKILVVVLVLVAGLSTQGFAQQSSVKIGFKGGYSATGWQGDAVKSFQDLVGYTDGNVETRMRQGFHAGMFLSIPLGPGFEFEPGVQYSQKGMVLEGRVPGENIQFLNTKVTVTNKAEYLDVPLLAKVYIGEGFNVFAGPQLSLLLSNKVNVSAGALGFSAYNDDFNWKSSQRPVDVGLSGGAGYQFQNGLSLSGSYDFGLTTVDNDATYKSYNHGFKGSVGFRF